MLFERKSFSNARRCYVDRVKWETPLALHRPARYPVGRPLRCVAPEHAFSAPIPGTVDHEDCCAVHAGDCLFGGSYRILPLFGDREEFSLTDLNGKSNRHPIPQSFTLA